MPSHQQSPDQSQASAAPGSGPESGGGYGNNAAVDMAAGDGAADNTATGGLGGRGFGLEAKLAESEAGPGSTTPGDDVTGETAR